MQAVSHVTSGTTTTSSYGYDTAGDTTTRPGQTLTYDAEGKISTITAGSTSESDVYDASGNLLLQKDSTTGTTLFLGATELHLATGSTTASAVRTYTANGSPVAERSTVAGVSGSTVTWLAADAQNTVNLQVVATSGVATARRQDPFGQSRGTSPTTWSDGHGFLNATTSALTNLTQLGARMYDPTIGRFLSVDPVLSPAEPQQNNGYSYAHNSPIDLSDPTGLTPYGTACSDFGGGCGFVAPTHGAGEQSPAAPGNAARVKLSAHVYGSANDPHLKALKLEWQAVVGNSPVGAVAELNIWYEICENGGGCPDGFFDTLRQTQGDSLGGPPSAAEGLVNQGAAILITGRGGSEWVDPNGFPFAQDGSKTSDSFSDGGKFPHQKINDVAQKLAKGEMAPEDVPVQIIQNDQGGYTILNTRSSKSLWRAGIPRDEWVYQDVTGNPKAMVRYANQMKKNPRPGGYDDVLDGDEFGSVGGDFVAP